MVLFICMSSEAFTPRPCLHLNTCMWLVQALESLLLCFSTARKLLSIRAWLWVSALGSTGLKLKRKAAWSWSPSDGRSLSFAQITLSQLQFLLPREMQFENPIGAPPRSLACGGSRVPARPLPSVATPRISLSAGNTRRAGRCCSVFVAVD